MSFVHLHLHTQYSLVDGLIDLKPLVKHCAELGMPAVAMTDECNLFAVVKFYRAALSAGIKPIFGADFWLEADENSLPTRLTVLCQNNTGYANLFQLISRAYLEGERRQDNSLPIIKRAWLTQKSLYGLIVLSGGIEGDIGQALLTGQPKRAETWLKNALSLFPEQRFYIEVSRVGHAMEQRYLEAVLPLAQQYQVPIVATQGVRFLEQTDFDAHEVRVAIHDGYTMEDPNRPKRYLPKQYFCPPDVMAETFADLPQAIANTVEIAKRCNVTMTLDQPCLPQFPVPEGMDEATYLRRVSAEGLQARFQTALADIDTPEQQATYTARLDIELDVIISMGFPGYFLIVADFIQWAKQHDIPVGPGRGSGAGSLVAYALGITDINPMPYDLLFERFLNPERVSMPDFDIDFCMAGRDRVIEYVAERYGQSAVSQIITYGTMAAKAVVRDVGRVMGQSYGFVDSIAKLIPFEIGMTLKKALGDEPALQARYDLEEDVKTIIDMGLKLEGTVRNVGKHAGGVVIAPSQLTDFCPIYCEQDSKQLVSQFDKNDVEAAGLVKFDFLGLRNLTIIHSAVKIINAIHRTAEDQTAFAIENIPLDDAATFDLLKRYQTTAVFQLESLGMKDLIKRLQPDSFEDIVALVALFRPGPLQSGMVDDFIDRKHGRADLAYPHPDTEEILQPTYGIILYQEQVMQIAQVLAGYTLGGADLLRRAMGKKKPEEMAKQREVFMSGAIKNGIEDKTAAYIFDLMEKFAGYGFNKSHSAAYALVAYQTAYLKAHYPAAFMASVLSSDMDNTDKIVIFVEDAWDLNLKVLPPDINQSHYEFTVEEGAIRFGLVAIKGVGEAAIIDMIEARTTASYQDLFDFCQRVDLRKVNRRVFEALIDAGAFDGFGQSRATLLGNIEKAMHFADQQSENQASGQDDLFALTDSTQQLEQPEYVAVEQMSRLQKLLREKSVLGCFLSGHPVIEYVNELNHMAVVPLNAVKPTPKGKTCRVAGMIVESRRIRTKSGSIMRALVLDDSRARLEVLVFSDVLDQLADHVQVDSIVVAEVEVKYDAFNDRQRISVAQVLSLGEARACYAKKLHLQVSKQQADAGFMQALQQLLGQHQQTSCPIEITYQTPSATAEVTLAENCQMHLSEPVLAELSTLLGSAHVDVVY